MGYYRIFTWFFMFLPNSNDINAVSYWHINVRFAVSHWMSSQVLPPNVNGLMIAEVTFYGTKMIYQSVEGNEVMQSLIVSSEWWGHNRVSFALLKGQEISEYSFPCLQFPSNPNRTNVLTCQWSWTGISVLRLLIFWC